MSVIVVLLTFFALWLLVVNRRLVYNPYKVTLIIGKKGTGKSSLCAYYAQKHYKKNTGPVYSNMGVGLPLTYDYYKYQYPAGSLLIIDEAGLAHNSRSFKTFPPEAIEFYKNARKNKLNIILASHTADVDKQIRIATDYVYVVRPLPFSYFAVVRSQLDVALVKNSETGETRYTDTEKNCGIPKIYYLPSILIKGMEFDSFDSSVGVEKRPRA